MDKLDLFKAIYTDFGDLAKTRGRVTEADTRANIIDRILHDVLDWPRDNVRREKYSNPGFIDYELKIGRPMVVIEAKAVGASFVFPYKKNEGVRHVKIGGLLTAVKDAYDAVMQAQRYCADGGFRFGVATNGYSFVIFRAIVDGSSWKEGSATVFASIKVVEENFVEFLDLLSYSAVKDGLLEKRFRLTVSVNRDFYRPIDMLVDRDSTYGRNVYNVALRPYVERYFGDIASQDAVSILEKCYVQSRPIQVIDADLKIQIRDTIPHFAASAEELTGAGADSNFAKLLNSSTTVQGGKPHVVLLMGGIGSGKTTFLKRFFNIVAPEYARTDRGALYLHLDFLGAEDQAERLSAEIWARVSRALRDRIPALRERALLEQIFVSDLVTIRSIHEKTPEVMERRVQESLMKYSENDEKFSHAVLRHYVGAGSVPLVVFDNVDQLATPAQILVFTYAQNLATNFGCMVILGLREESYCTAQMQKHLTAYTIRPYHLASPSFRELIEVRIDLATNTAANAGSAAEGALDEFDLRLPTNQPILDFFNALRRSIFHSNQNIGRMIEAISFGNMRFALDLFNNFIMSGATDISKIIRIFQEQDRYHVPFHEFAKSVMLGDYRFYKESRSFVINLFDVSSGQNGSHFTALRLLSLLLYGRNKESAADGFVSLQHVISVFSDSFDNEDDCVRVILKLIKLPRQLLELDTRRSDSIEGASLVRITSAGVYYIEYLVNAFAYLDLVWHDTPFGSRGICDNLAKRISATELNERLARVDYFLDYLVEEEQAELRDRGLLGTTGFHGPFMARIRMQFNREKRLVLKRASA